MTVRLASFFAVCTLVSGCASPPVVPSRIPIDPAPSSVVSVGDGDAQVSGIVVHARTEQALPNALVLLDCECWSETHELMTDERGQYRFVGLGAGSYTVTVMVGQDRGVESVAVRGAGDTWAAFALDPQDEVSCLEVSSQPRTSHCPY